MSELSDVDLNTPTYDTYIERGVLSEKSAIYMSSQKCLINLYSPSFYFLSNEKRPVRSVANLSTSTRPSAVNWTVIVKKIPPYSYAN